MRRLPVFNILFTLAVLGLGWAGAQPSQLDVLGVQTQFTTVSLGDFRSGGPPPNGIPPLGFQNDASLKDTRPAKYETVRQARAWLKEREPVILVTVNGETGIFPLQVLIWHEIANVTLGGVPVAVTFCPLCNTALVADRRVPVGMDRRARLGPKVRVEDGAVLVSFGVSGLLYNSDLVMFDSATHTLWYQAVGRALTGTLAGTRLRLYPSLMVPFGEAAQEAPEARVLSKQTGYDRAYGRNPYVGYDDADAPPFLYDGPLDGRLPPKARVVTVAVGAARAAYPFGVLAEQGAVNDRVGDTPVAIFWQKGAASALGAADIAGARDVGSGVAFDRRVNGRTLTFFHTAAGFRDRETGSTWTLTGQGVAGPLRGQRLTPVEHANYFWFAWAAYAPETRVYAPK